MKMVLLSLLSAGVVIVICALPALAAETTSLHFAGTFDSSSTISSPPLAPASFDELTSSSFFASTVGIVDSRSQVRDVQLYFWHLSATSVTVRAYVDSEQVGGMAGVPTLVGAGDLNFSDSGDKLPSGSSIDMRVSVAWVGSAKSNVAVSFSTVTLVASSSQLTVVLQNGSRGGLVDFDGDLIDDLVIFRPELGIWAVRLSSMEGAVLWRQWGLPQDFPIAGDYTGDGIADLVVWRPSNGNWYICRSDNGFDCGSDGGNTVYQFGLPGDRPIKADYDHDGILDLAVWRPTLGWFIYRGSMTNEAVVTQWGLPTDIPLQTGPNE